MNGGEISGNYNSGVDIGKIWGETSSGTATFEMNDGIICDNRGEYEYSIEAAAGGGVIGHNGANMTMTGGEITRNNGEWGGGVAMASSTTYTGPRNTFTMTGGTVSGNRATYSSGGGLYLQSTDFVKSGGGTVYGSNGGADANVAANGLGHAVYCLNAGDGEKVRNTTAGPDVNLRSDIFPGWQ
jgi:hypothetical protein